MTEQEIARLRALIENATPLPWEVVFEPGKHIVIGSRTEHTGVCVIFNDVHDLEYKQDNAALIVSAVNAIPALLDEVEKLKHELTIATLVMGNLINKVPVTDEDMQWAREKIAELDKEWNKDLVKKYKPCGGTDAIIDPKPQKWEGK